MAKHETVGTVEREAFLKKRRVVLLSNLMQASLQRKIYKQNYIIALS